MISNILNLLSDYKYTPLSVSVAGIYVNSKIDYDKSYFITIINEKETGPVSDALINNIRNSIFKSFSNSPNEPELLFLLIPAGPIGHTEVFNSNDAYWIIDNYNKRLMVYENPCDEFNALRGPLENIVTDSDISSVFSYQNTERNSLSPRNFSYYIKKLNVTPANSVIVLINIFVFVLTILFSVTGTADLVSLGSIGWESFFVNHQYYRLITSMFLHSGISHITNNMLVLIMLGTYLEKSVGSISYVIIYTLSGIIGSFTSLFYYHNSGYIINSVGASGCILGIVGALLFIIIKFHGKAEGLSFRQIIFIAFISIYGGIATSGVDNAAHIGGFIGGFIVCMLIELMYPHAKE